MISKKYRLNEKWVKKVLSKWKPFFSYWLVLNYSSNRIWFNRFSIVIWWKSILSNVWRNFFRRYFYDLIKKNIFTKNWFDFVFVLKKSVKLDHKNKDDLDNFQRDILFLLNKFNNER